MTREELEKKFIALGLPEGAAKHYAKREQQDKNFAWLAAYHFVYGLNEDLRFFDDTYPDMLRDGRITTSETTALMEAGATPEQIADFAYQIALESYCSVLQLITNGCAEYDTEDFPSWELVERTPDGEFTGRVVTEMQDLIPY